MSEKQKSNTAFIGGMSSKQLASSKLILAWTPFFRQNLTTALIRWFGNRTCLYSCVYTNDRQRVADADALIFHPREGMERLPAIRHRQQRYVFFLLEPPTHTGNIGRFHLPAGFFNLTMTYRRDSDVLMNYDTMFPIASTDPNLANNAPYEWHEVIDTVTLKHKMAVHIVSNCRAHSRRDVYVRQLITDGLEVDTFGKCGKRLNDCAYPSRCEEQFVSKYRFYLAFENSVCRDYVTEKFWRMKKLIVPIVLRNEDYVHITPIGSYIAVDQFQSTLQLVDYLKYLAQNQTEYLKYFEWTKTYRGPDNTWPFGLGHWSGVCDLCKLLHNKSVPAKSYDNIRKWWFDDAKCEHGFGETLAKKQQLNRSSIAPGVYDTSTLKSIRK